MMKNGYSVKALLASQQGPFGAGVTARFHVSVNGDQSKGKRFEGLVREFQRQGINMVSAIPAHDVKDCGRVIHAPGDIVLGTLTPRQIVSLQGLGFELRPHSSPGP